MRQAVELPAGNGVPARRSRPVHKRREPAGRRRLRRRRHRDAHGARGHARDAHGRHRGAVPGRLSGRQVRDDSGDGEGGARTDARDSTHSPSFRPTAARWSMRCFPVPDAVMGAGGAGGASGGRGRRGGDAGQRGGTGGPAGRRAAPGGSVGGTFGGAARGGDGRRRRQHGTRRHRAGRAARRAPRTASTTTTTIATATSIAPTAIAPGRPVRAPGSGWPVGVMVSGLASCPSGYTNVVHAHVRD